MSVTIIQARTSSRRFPNKVLTKINNIPMLTFVYDRVKKAKKIKKIIIAFSKNNSDNELQKYCKKKKYNYFRGSLNNVLERYSKVSQKYKVNSFVRVNGDSPCIDPELIDYGLKLFQKKDCDIVTNVFPRSFPKGVSVEVIKSSLVHKLVKNKKLSKYNKEHMTSYFYKNYKKFNIVNFKNRKNYSKFNLAVDKKDDLKKIEKILIRKKFLDYTWKKIIKIIYKR